MSAVVVTVAALLLLGLVAFAVHVLRDDGRDEPAPLPAGDLWWDREPATGEWFANLRPPQPRQPLELMPRPPHIRDRRP